jgi:hypothetical protein
VQTYSPEVAKLLRQPNLVGYLRAKLDQLPQRIRQDKLVIQVNGELQTMAKLVSFSPDHVPTPEEVKTLNQTAATLTKEISTGK